jgi:hypothetical protein
VPGLGDNTAHAGSNISCSPSASCYQAKSISDFHFTGTPLNEALILIWRAVPFSPNCKRPV